jgi:hypothetical protein
VFLLCIECILYSVPLVYRMFSVHTHTYIHIEGDLTRPRHRVEVREVREVRPPGKA